MRYSLRDFFVLMIATVTGWPIANINRYVPGARRAARRKQGPD